MTILILGVSGMLGHILLRELTRNHHVIGTIRNKKNSTLLNRSFFSNIVENVNADDISCIKNIIDTIKPKVIVNCIGIVKQLPESQDPVKSISINSLFPHQIAQLCQERGIRLIHYSTDCVFSGKRGNYDETDNPDAYDLYGRSKFLGEVIGPCCLTIRTSLIGRELSGYHSLLEWLFRQEGKVIHGYTKVIFSGLTTYAHAIILGDMITKKPEMTGLYHVASEPISKYDLLKKIIIQFNLNITINLDDSIVCDRSLNGSLFKETSGIVIPSWDEMIDQLYNDKTPNNNHDNVHE